jgi:hypothetical protein
MAPFRRFPPESRFVGCFPDLEPFSIVAPVHSQAKQGANLAARERRTASYLPRTKMLMPRYVTGRIPISVVVQAL